MAAGRVWPMPESAMRSKTVRPYDQDSLLLMPPSVRDWVSSDSQASSRSRVLARAPKPPLAVDSAGIG
jgi:hypothetical protein